MKLTELHDLTKIPYGTLRIAVWEGRLAKDPTLPDFFLSVRKGHFNGGQHKEIIATKALANYLEAGSEWEREGWFSLIIQMGYTIYFSNADCLSAELRRL